MLSETLLYQANGEGCFEGENGNYANAAGRQLHFVAVQSQRSVNCQTPTPDSEMAVRTNPGCTKGKRDFTLPFDL